MARAWTHRVLFPTLLAAVLLGLFTLDLSWATLDVTTTASAGFAEVFGSSTRIARRDRSRRTRHCGRIVHCAGVFGRAGLGWGGSPGSDCRRSQRPQRSVHDRRRVGVALVQKAGATPAMLFLAIGVANFVVAVVIARTMPTSPLRDFLSVLLRVLYRLEVHGLENVAKAGPHPIIALNHVSFLDAAIALAVLEQEPIFAIDHGIAQRWWVKPFLRLIARHAARSDQADGDAHTDQRGQRRRDADYLPRGAHHRHRQPDESL